MNKQESYQITKKEYNYLIAVDVMKPHLSNMPPQGYFFIGTYDDIEDAKTRLDGMNW